MIYCAKIIIIFKSFHFFGKNIPDRYKKHLISPCFNCLLAVKQSVGSFCDASRQTLKQWVRTVHVRTRCP